MMWRKRLYLELLLAAVSASAVAGCAGEAASGAMGAKVGALEAVCVESGDEVPPHAWVCGEERVVECTTHEGAVVETITVPLPPPTEEGDEADATSASSCDEAALLVDDAGPFPVGEHLVVVSDAARPTGDGAGTEVCASKLVVVDTAPPVVTPHVVELWPPNHKMHHFVPLDCVDVEDACDPEVEVVFLSATSDEAADDTGDGKTDPDIAALGCDGVDLRAERQGGGDGRVYTLIWRATDASGNAVEGTCQVVVPHDHGKGEAVDSGAAVTVDANCEVGDE